MGSQTLEILRQGVWASLTGGWFYDPHQNVFCNAAHLYIWLALLCSPFVSYLYFSNSVVTWILYCSFVAIIFITLKTINFTLHRMYDSAQGFPTAGQKSNVEVIRNEDEGIELQELGSRAAVGVTPPVGCSSRNSFIEPRSDNSNADSQGSLENNLAGTIDLKVDVHRKNSSESSEGGLHLNRGDSTDVGQVSTSEINSSTVQRHQKHQRHQQQQQRRASTQPPTAASISSVTETGQVGRVCASRTSLESPPADATSEFNINWALNHSRLQSLASLPYLEYCTKSSLQLAPSTSVQLSRRRHSNVTSGNHKSTRHQANSHNPSQRSANLNNNQQRGPINAVRRIKSAALETCPASSSISNLAVHPNSAEALLVGQNPPPSKKLVRNDNGYLLALLRDSSQQNFTTVVDNVYPIAETVDEKQVEETLRRSNDDVSDDTDSGFSRVGSDTDSDVSIKGAQSDDSDTENNGSQSPLLDRTKTDHHQILSKNVSGKSQSSCKAKTSASTADLNVKYSSKNQTERAVSSKDLLPNREPSGLELLFHSESESSSVKGIADTAGASDGCIQKLPKNLGAIPKATRTNTQAGDAETRFRRRLFAISSSSPISSGTMMSSVSGSQQTPSIEKADNNKEDCGTLQSASSPNDDNDDVDTTNEGVASSSGYMRPRLNAMDRNARNRVRKLKRSTRTPRVRNPPQATSAIKVMATSTPEEAGVEGSSDPARKVEVCISKALHQRDNMHFATSFDDTSEGAIHCFMDEYGKWRSYTFSKTSSPSQTSTSLQQQSHHSNRRNASQDAASMITSALIASGEGSASLNNDMTSLTNNGGSSPLYDVSDRFTAPGIRIGSGITRTSIVGSTGPLSSLGLEGGFAPVAARFRFREDVESAAAAVIKQQQQLEQQQLQQQQKKRYKLHLWKHGPTLQITMDRLLLLALFDRDSSIYEVILSVVLATLCSILGSLVLQAGLYCDAGALAFCLTLAGAQYSLLKSVQPDAASPVHGFNKAAAYSRPVYLCLCTTIVLVTNKWLEERIMQSSSPTTNLTIYTFAVNTDSVLRNTRDCLCTFILLFPIAFSLGLFPQINTFAAYTLEQTDMHIFGGNATCSTLAAFFGVLRSIFVVLLLVGPAYAGLIEAGSTQHILFSIFCALLVSLSYHLSRCASDYAQLWVLIKRHVLPNEFFYTPVIAAAEKKVSTTDERRESSESTTCGESSAETETRRCSGQDSNFIDLSKTCQKSGNTHTLDPSIKSHGPGAVGNSDQSDPLPGKLLATVTARLRNDLLICPLIAVAVLALHSSTVFTVLQPDLNRVLRITAGCVGFILHYLVPQLRSHLPWLCASHPILRTSPVINHSTLPHGRDLRVALNVPWFERVAALLATAEKCALLPLLALATLTADSLKIADKFGPVLGTFLVVICGLKFLRSCYSDPAIQFKILIFAELFFSFDCKSCSETFLIDLPLATIGYRKLSELLLKFQFVVTYIAPWQITWGSAFHAFAQPFSVPHSAMLFLQAGISAVLSAPLSPFLGSAIFITSYVRPMKFWERDYNTRRADHSNTRLASHLERDLVVSDDNNLNSIFYEHLTRSLQHSLAGDLELGKWGPVSQGDCFVLASDYLNCLVHIIELGNGLCTFQVRGLEFRGTYCQQREVEAISEGVEDNDGCCCFQPGHLPHMLSLNAMFFVRWLAWHVASSHYVLEGYSISDNSAITTLQVFEFRKVLITYYVKSIIYYTTISEKLQSWLSSKSHVQKSLETTWNNSKYVDVDPVFNHNLDEDYDFRASGITRGSFCNVYLDWIQYCASRRSSNLDASRSSPLVSLVLGLSILGRRALGAVAHHSVSSVEFFLHGLHALFKGDFRVTSPRDEWVFADMDLLHTVVAPAVRMALKLHQDHFLSPDEYEDPAILFGSMSGVCTRRAEQARARREEDLITGNTSSNQRHFQNCGDEDSQSELSSKLQPASSQRRSRSYSHQSFRQHQSRVSRNRRSEDNRQSTSLSETLDQENACDGTCSAQCGGLVISHEADPAWRAAVLSGTPNLLALRHVMDDGADEYRVIRLLKRHLSFRVIKLNRECVRGLWAGQQQELVYLRNRNPERGSIQNAKQALRNIINSSCDQPIGYPIYVSPLTTSYVDTHEGITSVVGGPFTVSTLKQTVVSLWRRIRTRCRQGCSSGEQINLGESVLGSSCTERANTLTGTATLANTLTPAAQQQGALQTTPVGGNIGIPLSPYGSSQTMASVTNKPSGSTLLAGFLNNKSSMSGTDQKENIGLNNNSTNFSRTENKDQRGASLERDNSGNTDSDAIDKEKTSDRFKYVSDWIEHESVNVSKLNKADLEYAYHVAGRISEFLSVLERSGGNIASGNEFSNNASGHEGGNVSGLGTNTSSNSAENSGAVIREALNGFYDSIFARQRLEPRSSSTLPVAASQSGRENILRQTGASLPAVVRAAVTRDCEPGVAALLNKIDRERTAVHNRKIRNNLQDNEIIVSHYGSDRQKNCSEDIHEDKDSDSEPSEDDEQVNIVPSGAIKEIDVTVTNKVQSASSEETENSGDYDENHGSGQEPEQSPTHLIDVSEELEKDADSLNTLARIVDPAQVYDCLDLGRRIDVVWPCEEMRKAGGRSAWGRWVPQKDMTGTIVHYWRPGHADPAQRSHCGKVIVLLNIDGHYVPVAKTGIELI